MTVGSLGAAGLWEISWGNAWEGDSRGGPRIRGWGQCVWGGSAEAPEQQGERGPSMWP